MASRKTLDGLATSIMSLKKGEIIKRLRCFNGRFKLDFTEEYLDSLSPEKLRHILLAAMMTSSR